MHHAFTLIELLVVITIIIVLIAILAPSLDRAVYEAELTVCGTHQHGIAIGAIAYTQDYKRRFPFRDGVEAKKGIRPTSLATAPPALDATKRYDFRPLIRPYMPINGLHQCPLVQRVELDAAHPDTQVFSSYALWYGWTSTKPAKMSRRV